jgi:hypothetical protein
MTVRYLHNTSGEYVAFVSGSGIFAPDATWLGVLVGETVHNTLGDPVGFLKADDRLIRLCATSAERQIPQPRHPLPPVRPIPPKRKLFMEAVTHPYEDVFLRAGATLRALLSWTRLQELEELQGCSVGAADGTFLGTIARDPAVPGSLADVAGPHRQPDAETSIYNPAGPYGDRWSSLSAFNPSATSPPRIERDGKVLAHLTTNPSFTIRVHPFELHAWLHR